MATFPKLIAVIHLPPLPGSPRAARLHPGDALDQAGKRALDEAKMLAKAGFGGIIVENFGDAPFYAAHVPPETIVAMTVIVAALKDTVSIPLGVNILRNDARAALAMASVLECDWIRVNVLSGVAASDQGWLVGEAAYLSRERIRLGNTDLKILADIHVKHAQTLSSPHRAAALEDTFFRAGADAVIATGEGTGKSIDIGELQALHKVAKSHKIPLLLGSGASAQQASVLRKACDGVIVSSNLRQGGRAGQPLDAARVKAFVKAFRA